MKANKTPAPGQTPHFVSCNWFDGYKPLTVVLAREREWVAEIEASTQLTGPLKDSILTCAKQSVDMLATFLDQRQVDGTDYVEVYIDKIRKIAAQNFIIYWVRTHSLTCDLLNRSMIANGITDVTLHPATI